MTGMGITSDSCAFLHNFKFVFNGLLYVALAKWLPFEASRRECLKTKGSKPIF